MPITRDLTDPTLIAEGVDPEAGLKEPLFENLEIPEDLGPVTIIVDDHKVKRFAFTQDDYHPWHFSDDTPFGHRIAQAGLLTNDLVQLYTTRFAASRTAALHTEEQLWYDSAVRVGEKVTMQGCYVEAYELRGQGYVVMEAQAVGEDGRSLLRHRGIEILHTSPAEIAGRGSTAGGTGPRVTGEFDTTLPYARTAGSGLQVGMPIEPLYKQITQEQASIFSRAGEYVRNIHSDLDKARTHGLRIPIIQGQQECCLITELLTRFFGAKWFTSGWIKVKFVQTVEVFEDMTVGGIVTKVHMEDGEARRVELEVWVRRGDGKLSTVGWASCELELAAPPAVLSLEPREPSLP